MVSRHRLRKRPKPEAIVDIGHRNECRNNRNRKTTRPNSLVRWSTRTPKMSCHSSFGLVQIIYNYLGTISLVIGGLSGALHILYYFIKGMNLTLNATIAKVTAGTALPPAFVMLFAAFHLDDLGCVTNLGLYVFIGAISVIWITVTVLFPKSIEKTPRPQG